MMHLNPLVLVGAVIGVITALLVAAYAAVKDKKTAMGFERNMEDGEIMRRLARYARPYLSKFLIVGVLMLFSIAYDIISPLIVGRIEELVAGDFSLNALAAGVAVYAGVLVFSMGSTYLQAVILQRVGQRIISDLREDLFRHIESLAHEQLNEIPVGKLVTRVTNDTNAISMMFTNLLVQLTKNSFVILGILVAMLCLNYELTLMVLCFVPFIVIFTVIFRKFSRRANRKLKNATTDLNTYLSENLSGIKVTQIFGREDEKMEDFRQKSQKLARANQEQIFVFSVFRPLVYMLYISSILCLFYLGGMGHLNNVSFLGQTISSGTVVTFYMYISKFFTPIQNLAEQFNWLQSALASAEKVFSVMDIQPKMQDAPDAIELDEVKGEIEFRDENTGSWVKITPADSLSYDVTVDFNSRVLGVQEAHWKENADYVGRVAPCRTFCFFHELEALASRGLVKGGDVDNAIVIVEHPVTKEQIDKMCVLFGQPRLSVTENGYLSNLKLHFPNECGRHKLLDLIGDMRLVGGYLKAHISAYKPGHRINSAAALAVTEKI